METRRAAGVSLTRVRGRPQELAEATEPDHVAAETADVLYFALVRAAAAGVPLEAVEAHLDYRALCVAAEGARPPTSQRVTALPVNCWNAALARALTTPAPLCFSNVQQGEAPSW